MKIFSSSGKSICKSSAPRRPTSPARLADCTTLPSGTVILTDTPHEIGAARKPPVFLQPGDTVTIEIDKIGTLTNPVVAEAGG